MLAILSAPPANAASRWFAAAEELGDFMGILFGRVVGDHQGGRVVGDHQGGRVVGDHHGRLPGEGSEVEWRHVSHLESDGIGAFARLLEQQGTPAPVLPCASIAGRGIAGPLWRYWRHRRDASPPAGRRDWPAPDHAAHQAPGDRAWHLFDQTDTAAILEACRREKVSVNSLLLHHLDRAIRPELGLADARIPWMIPVNLRDESNAHSTANHVSSIEAVIAADDTAQGIHRQLRERLDRGEHRVGALLMGLGKFLSPKRCQAILARDRAKNEGSIGAFSNLGAWDAAGALPTQDSWLFCPPVGGGQRLAAGCVTFQGRLGLVIQTHADEAREASLAGDWMERWVEALRAVRD